MTNALKAKNKLGFIKVSVKEPIDNTSDEAYACLWDDLKERFTVANIPHIFHLKASLVSIKQNGAPIINYYTKLRSIWDELESSHAFDSCATCDTCSFTKLVVVELENDRIYQFIIGLDHAVYGTLTTQILNSNPLPTINRVFAMVIQEKTHKAMVRSSETPSNALGCAITNAPSDPPKPHIICTHCGSPNHDISRYYKLYGYPDRTLAGRGRRYGHSTPR
ncbi:uncharacterized protein LOC133287703 [Gastrolobium bilobum]|uniref:uncharacterized protein LOC133287703 n=1 Tax=Gastrolobium bilobum TaxID=150636 RepID=UPI002AB216CA|nr:uncharacterized protein LOC133287703 [Gastrolobium bilobum]